MTFLSTTQLVSLAAYLVAAGLLWQRLIAIQHGSSKPGLRSRAGLVALAGLLFHLASLVPGMISSDRLQLGLGSASSTVAAVVISIYLLVYLRKPVENLGLMLLPIAALSVFSHWVSPGSGVSISTTPLATMHIAISMLAYGLLAIAAAQSLLLLFQERQLKGHHPGGVLQALPPMQSVEILMFQLIGIGFTLLTLTLVSGVFFSDEVFGKPFRFNHHVVLSIGGWAVFGILLLARKMLGWRGRVASSWTLTGFGLLLLAYFGTKFVAEVILQRSV